LVVSVLICNSSRSSERKVPAQESRQFTCLPVYRPIKPTSLHYISLPFSTCWEEEVQLPMGKAVAKKRRTRASWVLRYALLTPTPPTLLSFRETPTRYLRDWLTDKPGWTSTQHCVWSMGKPRMGPETPPCWFLKSLER
jgi:hypothetical protein